MKQQSDILNHYAVSGTAYIHACGKAATDLLIHHLDCKPGEHILEIGFGTGVTLATLAIQFSSSKFYGIELSEMMFRSAKKRFRFAGVDKEIDSQIPESALILPFKDNTFDKIFIESVLAIQKGENLKSLLGEIHRVLKPGGILLFNETIWLESTSNDKIEEINSLGESYFGIIQANETYPYLKDWKHLLKSLNFEIEFTLDLDIISTEKVKPVGKILKLFLYDTVNSLRFKLNPVHRKADKKFNLKMKSLNETGQNFMKGYLFKMHS